MDIPDWLSWVSLKAFANSNFFTSFIGALAGAWAGAWAVQRIADRSRLRSRLLDELGATNAGIELAHAISSTYLNLKEQHIRKLKDNYDRLRVAVHAHHQGLREGTIPPGTVMDIGLLDLQSIGVMRVQIAQLQTVVLEKLSARGRPGPLVTVLGQSVDTLNDTITTRNRQIAAYQASNAPLNEKVAYLFGLPRAGFLDETFGSTVTALYRQTDDCIYFSKLLCTDLSDHGDRTRVDFKREFRGHVPRVQRVLWDEVEKKGLLPPKSDYESWHTGFWRRVPRTHGRRAGKAWHWLRWHLRGSPIGSRLLRVKWWFSGRTKTATPKGQKIPR